MKTLVVVLLACLLIVFLVADASAGAGGTRGKGRSILFLIFLVLLLGPLLAGNAVTNQLLWSRALRVAKTELAKAAAEDPLWDPASLRDFAYERFRTLQSFWSENNRSDAEPLIHPVYREKFFQEMDKYAGAGLKNVISGVRIERIRLLNIYHPDEKGRDRFTAYFDGSMEDRVVDAQGRIVAKQGDVKGKSKREISEFWTFGREGTDWLLMDIAQDDACLEDTVGSAYRTASSAGGIIVALAGYALYFLLVKAIFFS